jgi:thioredoxin 1
MTIDINEGNFEEEIVYSDVPVVVDFWSKRCRPCLAFAPTFKKLSKKYKDQIRFLKCDVAKNKALTDLFNVKSIPTLLLFNDGELQDRMVGNYDIEKLEEKLKNLMEKCQE